MTEHKGVFEIVKKINVGQFHDDAGNTYDVIERVKQIKKADVWRNYCPEWVAGLHHIMWKGSEL